MPLRRSRALDLSSKRRAYLIFQPARFRSGHRRQEKQQPTALQLIAVYTCAEGETRIYLIHIYSPYR